jgi:glycosyltransferase involved in cell wall biosynthesis
LNPVDSTRLTVLFVAAMGGLGGPVKRLATLLANVTGVRRVLIKPRSELLDKRMLELGSVDEHISVRRSAQRSYVGSLMLMARIFARASSRKRPVDVIHANGIVEFALCWPAALLLRKPVVTWVGNYESPALVERFHSVFGSVSRRTRWNAVSSTAADVIADCGLAQRNAVKVVTNIVDPADVAPTADGRTYPDSKRLRIGYLQVAQSVKGFDLLPRVIKELSDIHHLVLFLIFAKRNGHPSWDELSSFPSEVVEVRPRTAKVGDVYAECDIVFSPSRAESFNRVAAEALATGTPLVASDLEPVREVVGEVGLLFPTEDVTAAASCIRRLVHDPELRVLLSRAGTLRSKTWLPGPVAEEFVAQYRSLAKPRPGL